MIVTSVATKFLDVSGRLLIYRSEVLCNVLDLLPKFTEEAREFVEACTSMGEDKIRGNWRGNHWFCIAGADHNNKKVNSSVKAIPTIIEDSGSFSF